MINRPTLTTAARNTASCSGLTSAAYSNRGRFDQAGPDFGHWNFPRNFTRPGGSHPAARTGLTQKRQVLRPVDSAG